MWPLQLAKLLGINIPLIQAPMAGGTTTPELVAAVANAGALGSLGAGYLPADTLIKNIAKIKSLTDKPFAVSLFVPEAHSASMAQMLKMREILIKNCAQLGVEINIPQAPFLPSFAEQIDIIIEEKIKICSFTFGVPDQEYLKILKEHNVILIGTATQILEGKILEENGVDIIVAQGSEAGGHRGSFGRNYQDGLIGLMALVPQLVDHLHTPVVAAGGIMDARGVKAAFALGALGVQMGTAFLSCPESGIHPKFKEILMNTKIDNTILTKSYSGKLVRAIKNAYIESMQEYENELLDYPIQNAMTMSLRKAAEKQNNSDFMAMWSGQAAYLSQGLPAAELIAKLDEAMRG